MTQPDEKNVSPPAPVGDEPNAPFPDEEIDVLDPEYICIHIGKPDKKRIRKSVQRLLMVYVLFVLFLSGVLSILLFEVLFLFDVMPAFLRTRTGMPFVLIAMLIFFAVLLSEGVSQAKLSSFNELINAMHRVAGGDFSARVEEDGEKNASMRDVLHSFNEMTKELSGIEMFRKDFINNFSHEFKTPIVSIRGFAKQLQRDDLTEEQRKEYTQIIVTEAERLSNMSSNVLLLTKLENQQIVTDKALYSLDEQIRSCILLLEKQWTEKDIDLQLNLDEVQFLGNEEMLTHVWVNLLSNAIKFSPQGGVLSVACSATQSTTIVEVADSGEGMDEKTCARIFEKFYQGDSAHATEGNGLGLSLVKRIVDLCGGEVQVQSVQGEGTKFTVILPNEREGKEKQKA